MTAFPQQGETRVRICDAESSDIVQRGETGELITHSQSIMPQYMGSKTSNENGFFTDKEGLRWFCTGYRAVMVDSGLIYITGRTSSILKGAGIPIDPVALEKSIALFLGADELVCVVALPSKTLGHAPLAVVSALGGKDKQEILNHNIQTFGETYALADVIQLRDLGLDARSINAAGRMIKKDILDIVARSGCVNGGQ